MKQYIHYSHTCAMQFVTYFQLNQPTRCSKFSSLWLVIEIQLKKFRAPSCLSSGATTTAVAASGLPSELGESSAVGCGRASRPAGPSTTNSTAITTQQRLSQRLVLHLLSSWWWAWGRPKHVELYITSSNKLERSLPLVCWFYLNWNLQLRG